MLYFSYGSNMSINRLRARVPSATKVGVGKLAKHALVFHKRSRMDGSAKCDVKETGSPEHIVYGVIFRLAVAEKPLLDQKEGLGYGYEQKDVLIEMQDGKIIQAYTYYATEVDPELKPLDWYKTHVLIGARQNNLPAEYIRKIEAVEAVADSDKERQNIELSIYQ